MINRNQRKRQFLQWLAQHFCHNNPVVNQFIQYLMTEPNSIQYVTFTEASHFTPRGVYISYRTQTDTPFMYYKQYRQFPLCEQAFHDFRLNAQMYKEQFYIEIDIPDVYSILYQFDIFEENPYLPIEEKQDEINEQWLDRLSQDVQIDFWRSKINENLELHNFEMVEYYLQLIENAKGE